MGSGPGVARVLVSCISEIKTQFILDMQIGFIKDSETDLAEITILNAKEIKGDPSILVLFDRGYLGLKFINWLEQKDIKYWFRLSSNDYKKERTQMGGDDELVQFMHTCNRIIKIRKKYPTEARQLKENEYTQVRIVKDQTLSGGEIGFLTDLTGTEVPYLEISNLYFKRWNIEKSYNTLKNKLKFERQCNHLYIPRFLVTGSSIQHGRRGPAQCQSKAGRRGMGKRIEEPYSCKGNYGNGSV